MAIYMPMITELVVAMLACARIGAIHSIGNFNITINTYMHFHEKKILIEFFSTDVIRENAHILWMATVSQKM